MWKYALYYRKPHEDIHLVGLEDITDAKPHQELQKITAPSKRSRPVTLEGMHEKMMGSDISNN